MKNKIRVCAINLCIHSAAFALLVGLNDIAHKLYKAWIGDFGSRGIAPGSVTLLVILLFIVFRGDYSAQSGEDFTGRGICSDYRLVFIAKPPIACGVLLRCRWVADVCLNFRSVAAQ